MPICIKKQTFILQLLCLTKGKLKLTTFCFIEGPCATCPLRRKCIKNSGNKCYHEFKGHI